MSLKNNLILVVDGVGENHTSTPDKFMSVDVDAAAAASKTKSTGANLFFIAIHNTLG